MFYILESYPFSFFSGRQGIPNSTLEVQTLINHSVNWVSSFIDRAQGCYTSYLQVQLLVLGPQDYLTGNQDSLPLRNFS